MKDGKTKSGTARHNPVGGNLPGKKGSHDQLRSTESQGKWKEISAEIDAVGTTVIEKTNKWNKSCKESAKRESELYKMLEQAAIDESPEHNARSMIKDLLHQLQKKGREG